MRYITFTDKGQAKEFKQKLNDLFLPPNYKGNLLDLNKSTDTDGTIIYYLQFEESTMVQPYLNRAANMAYKLLIKREQLIKPLNLKKMQEVNIHLIEYLNPELIKSRTKMKKAGHFALDKEAKQFLKAVDKAKLDAAAATPKIK